MWKQHSRWLVQVAPPTWWRCCQASHIRRATFTPPYRDSRSCTLHVNVGGGNIFQHKPAIYGLGGPYISGDHIFRDRAREKGEGVAILLSGPEIAVWRAAVEQWKARSSRLISAQLQAGSRKADHQHVLSCYAPTRAASRAVKDEILS